MTAFPKSKMTILTMTIMTDFRQSYKNSKYTPDFVFKNAINPKYISKNPTIRRSDIIKLKWKSR